LIDWLSVFSAACWPVCFWWMHRISANQNAMLEDLRKEAGEVRKISEEEQDLLRDLHPARQQMAGR
jgi:hypothetical protein